MNVGKVILSIWCPDEKTQDAVFDMMYEVVFYMAATTMEKLTGRDERPGVCITTVIGPGDETVEIGCGLEELV